jgi:outer membrane protein OmpA-like peptidoglycan-associated protein
MPNHKKVQVYFENAYDKCRDLEKNYYDGVSALDAGDCDTAITCFSKVITIAPNFRNCITLLKRSYQMCNKQVEVRTSSNGMGTLFTNREVRQGQEYDLYAGYSKNGVYKQDLPVFWDIAGRRTTEISTTVHVAFSRSGDFGFISALLSETDGTNRWTSARIKVTGKELTYFRVYDTDKKRWVDTISDPAGKPLVLSTRALKQFDTPLRDLPVVWKIYEVFFNYNSPDIKQEYIGGPQNLGNELKKDPDFRVVFEGNTDDTGTKYFNQVLSEKRAQNIRDYFVTNGFVGERHATSSGNGQIMPLVPNISEDNRKKNRRVDIFIRKR